MSDAVRTTGPGGVRFRSRLEARWAQFFTLLGWPWQYEPDLGLSKWIPDFVLQGGTGLLVEVKPVVTLQGFEQHHKRINASGAVAYTWIVGAALAFPASTSDTDPVVGVMNEFFDGGRLDSWRTVRLNDITWKIARPAVAFKRAQRAWITAGNDLQWSKQ